MLQIVFNLVGIAGGVLLAYYLGLQAYKKQKRFDECRHKYIDEGIEALHTELSEGFASYTRNWQMAHGLLRIIRDYDANNPIPLETVEIKFDSFEPKNLGVKYYYKVNQLLGDDVVQKWSLSFFTTLAAHRRLYFDQDIGFNLIKFLKTQNKVPEKCTEFYEKYYEKLDKWNAEIYKNLSLIDGLEELIKILRKKRNLSYETLDEIKEDRRIKDIVKQLNENFDKIHSSRKIN